MLDTSKLAVTSYGMRKLGVPVSIIIEIIAMIRMFPSLYGLEVGKYYVIVLTKSVVKDNHVCRTLNHEIMHAVVDYYFDEWTSLKLDKEWKKDGNSVLDRLTFEGYLGDD